MGMSSSQARMLTLTARMHDIEYKAQRIEAQKLQLANDSDKAYSTYLEALDAKKIQYRALNTDASYTYHDATYRDLLVGAPGSQYLLYTTGSNKLCLSEELVNIYNSSSSADDFVQNLKNYVSTGSAGDPDWWGGTSGSTGGGGSVTPGGPSGPGGSGGDDPDIPGGDDPDIPGGDDPDIPGGDDPDVPGGDDPDIPGGDDPDVPGGDDPETPGGDDPETPGGDDPEIPTENATLTRKGSNVKTLSAGLTDYVVKLTNAADGKDLYYTISTTESVKLEYLDNGRLLVKGNGATIKATAGQNDSLIIMGRNNNVDTNSGDDIVRVNYIIDSNDSVRYAYENDGIFQYNNTVNTGSGNDYVSNFGFNTIIMGGNGGDVLRDRQNWLTEYSSSLPMWGAASPSGVNYNSANYDSTYNNSDGKITLGGQGSYYGDCKFMSFLKSVISSPGFNLSNYVSITPQSGGTSWTVKFKQGADTATVTVTKSALEQTGVNDAGQTVKRRANGDVDLAIIENAFLQVLQRNGGYNLNQPADSKSLGQGDNSFLISKFLFGNDDTGYVFMNSANNNSLKTTVQKFVDGQISNLVVGTGSNPGNETLGLMSGHAYAVKDADPGNWVKVVNPWDYNDEILLDWDDFKSYFYCMYLFGDSYTQCGSLFSGSSMSVITETSVLNDLGAELANDGDATLQEQYMSLYTIIGQAIAADEYELVPGDMITSSVFLTNVVNEGFAYLKKFDKDSEEWKDTSVATTTELREVSDEIDLKKAEARYESDMRLINNKDRRYDTQLATCENERNAIKQEIETLKTVAKDNEERTFKLFS